MFKITLKLIVNIFLVPDVLFGLLIVIFLNYNPEADLVQCVFV